MDLREEGKLAKQRRSTIVESELVSRQLLLLQVVRLTKQPAQHLLDHGACGQRQLLQLRHGAQLVDLRVAQSSFDGTVSINAEVRQLRHVLGGQWRKGYL